MIIAIAAAMLQVATAQTVPSVSMDVQGRRTTLDSRVLSDEDNRIVVAYSEPKDTIQMTVHDGTDGVLQTTIPTISFDQPLAIRNDRTGLVTVYPTVVMHRTPTVVVKGQDSARSQFEIGRPRSAAEAAVGVCTPKAAQ